MSLLRWGICSAGLISFDYADALVSLPADEHKVVAVAARDLERAKRFAEQFEIPKVYDSYSAMANDPEVDIVYVGTTQNAHYDACKIFLNAGKHVLCEKTLTCATWQAEELIALAKAKKLFFMEAVWSRCFPLYQTLREVLEKGEIGKVQSVEVRFTFDATQSIAATRLVQDDMGGGVLWDLGVYALQFADWVMRDQPLSVQAVGSLYESGVDKTVSMLLQYPEGRFANLTVSLDAARENIGIVHGSEGKLVLEATVHSPVRLIVTRRNGESHTIEGEPMPHVKFPTKYNNSGGFVYEARHVRDCVNRGLLESPLVPQSMSIWVQRTIDHCLHQLGRPRLPQRPDA